MNLNGVLRNSQANEENKNGIFPAGIFARLLRGDAVDVVGLEEPWRSWVQEISVSNRKSRLDSFRERTKDRPDADDLLKAIFAIDPSVKPKENLYLAQVKTLAEAMRPRQRSPFVVKSIIPRRSLNIIYGREGSLKTMLLFDLCFSVASRRLWLPDLPGKGTIIGYEVTPTPVLWIDVDNGEDIIAERLAAFARAYDTASDTTFYWMSFPTPPILAANGLKDVIDCALNLGVGLIGIDNLLRISGVKDENSSEMDTAMSNLRQLAEKTGAAVVVIHHRTKDHNRDESLTIRGHSSISAAPDYIYLIKREDNGDGVMVLNTKARRRPVDPFAALFTYELEDDGETLHAARFFGAPLSNEKHDGLAMLKTKILEALKQLEKEHKINQTEIYRKVGGMKRTLGVALRDLVNEQKIACVSGPRNSNLYRLV